MKPRAPLVTLVALAACQGSPPVASRAAPPPAPSITDDALIGLWRARQRFGPDARGPLLLAHTAAGWSADFVGHRIAARVEHDELVFELPADAGAFRAHLPSAAPPARFTGHWISPRSEVHGTRFATPVELVADGAERWRGEVVPLDDSFTLYLRITRRADGVLAAFLRNPERNRGVQLAVDHVERDGDTIRLVGTRGHDAHATVLAGRYDAETAVLALAPGASGGYDFRRDAEASELYPRGQHPARYAYQPPPALADGWPTATLDDVAIDRAGIDAFIQHLIDMPIDSAHAPEVHAVLVARHGKLALEEYFHGEHRDRLHDTRSAAKSLTATLVGAAMHDGAPLALTSPLYQVMAGGAFPADLEPGKRAITLEHLLMMRAGFFCDDRDPGAPGNEDVMWDQTADPDLYHYALQVPLASAPDRQSIYCSMSPNLALGMVARATGGSILDTFDRLIARPLQITRYAWNLDPAGNPYGGGGVRMAPRDFMKLGQLMLDGGAWHGRVILDRGFVARASSPLHDLNGIQYGYLWWSIAYPYKDRTVRAFFAAGNGGQAVMVVPALDLVIAIFAGNYADRAPMIHVQQELAPTWILPAVREPGDDRHAPVVPRPFTSPYGTP
ncbi:MAG TPA: serine hydrolase [Kofleriaceae bacterium]|nr:serine hydrolase [Kofleriaceae bacterium]